MSFFKNKIKRIIKYIVKSTLKIFYKFRSPGIIQLGTQFNPKDGIGNTVLEISRSLSKNNIKNYIVADNFNLPLKNFIPFSCFTIKRKDIVILHYGYFYSHLNDFLNWGCFKKILFYHNITPAYFSWDNIKTALECEKGLFDLNQIKSAVNCSITVSEFNKKSLTEIGFKEVYVMPSPNRANFLLKYKKYGKKDKTINFIHVGRIVRHKCITDIIEIFINFYKLNKNSRLYIVGLDSNINYLNEIKKMISTYNLEQSIIILNSVDEETLSYIYSISNIYICMSEHEGFCVPLIEAMSFGIPIIAYNSSCISETLGDTGLLFNKKDFKFISTKILELLNNEIELKEISNKEIERYKSIFDNEIVTKNLINFLIVYLNLKK